MTDPITCPECEGSKGQRLGRLFLACQFCGGLGWVGGEYEPAEERPEPPEGPPRAWEHPSLAGTGLCGRCLGSRQIAHVEGGHLVQVCCPYCAAAPPAS